MTTSRKPITADEWVAGLRRFASFEEFVTREFCLVTAVRGIADFAERRQVMAVKDMTADLFGVARIPVLFVSGDDAEQVEWWTPLAELPEPLWLPMDVLSYAWYSDQQTGARNTDEIVYPSVPTERRTAPMVSGGFVFKALLEMSPLSRLIAADIREMATAKPVPEGESEPGSGPESGGAQDAPGSPAPPD